MTTPLHCKVCAKSLHGQQRLYCGRPCKRRAYAAKQKLREAQGLADVVDAHRANYVFGGSWMGELKELSADDKMLLNKHLVDLYVDDPQPPQIEVIREGFDPVERDISVITAPTPKQPSLPRRLYAYIQLLGHTLYHIFEGWRTK